MRVFVLVCRVLLAAVFLSSVGATLSEAFVLEDGYPVTPVIVLAIAAIVAWYRRETILPVLLRLDLRSARSGPRAQ